MAQEIAVRLGGENTGFRTMMQDSVNTAVRGAGQISDGVAGKFTNLKQVGTAVATALGLNLENIAENLARSFTRMSKEEEELFKKLDDLSTKVADANIKNMRQLLTEEQRYQANLGERDRLMQKIADNAGRTTADLVRQKRDELELASRIADIQTFEAKQAEERAKKAAEYQKARFEASEKEYAAQLQTLSTEEKIDSLKASIAAAQALLASGTLSQVNQEQISATLQERKNQLVLEEAKAREEVAKIEEKNTKALWESDQKRADATREELSLKDRKKKITNEIKLLEEEIEEGLENQVDVSEEIRRVDTLRGQLKEVEKKENENNLEIAKLLLKGEENLTKEEKLRLQVLQGITTQKKLDAEISALLAKGVQNLTPEERERLAVLTQQSDQIAKQVLGMQNLTSAVKGFIALTRTGREADDQSTIALEGALARAKSERDRMENDRSFATAFAPNGKDPRLFYLQLEINKMEDELKMRRTVSAYAARSGEDAARYRYGDTITDRALRDIKDVTERQAKDIENLTIAVTNAPMFRKTARRT